MFSKYLLGRPSDGGGLIGPQSSTQEAAEDVAAFVALFFHHFSALQGRKFHMAGESYAVRVPTLRELATSF